MPDAVAGGKDAGGRPPQVIRNEGAAQSSLGADHTSSSNAKSLFLLLALKRIRLVLGPGRDSFHAVVAHEHLATMPCCKGLSVEEIDAWRDHLIGVVCAASSLAVTDPMRHLVTLFSGSGVNPALDAKRLLVADVMARPAKATVFRFTGPPTIQLGSAARSSVLRAKLERGDLQDQVDYLSERERDTERHLIEDALRGRGGAEGRLRRLEQVVLGECSEVHLRSSFRAASHTARG